MFFLLYLGPSMKKTPNVPGNFQASFLSNLTLRQFNTHKIVRDLKGVNKLRGRLNWWARKKKQQTGDSFAKYLSFESLEREITWKKKYLERSLFQCTVQAKRKTLLPFFPFRYFNRRNIPGYVQPFQCLILHSQHDPLRARIFFFIRVYSLYFFDPTHNRNVHKQREGFRRRHAYLPQISGNSFLSQIVPVSGVLLQSGKKSTPFYLLLPIMRQNKSTLPDGTFSISFLKLEQLQNPSIYVSSLH